MFKIKIVRNVYNILDDSDKIYFELESGYKNKKLTIHMP